MSVEKTVPTRILIADDHDIVRQGICAIIARHHGLEVCGEAADGREAIAKARDLNPTSS
jgi:DNA-binding NarL/FixJ family response regulator